MNATSKKEEVVLITGSSSGIGRACCEQLSYSRIVYGGSRTQTSSDRWTYLKMDISDDASVRAAVGSIMLRHDRIDAVVHCAGFSLSGSVEETAEDEALRQFDTNYFGTVRVLQAALPIMRRQGSGKLIVIGSIAGLIGLPFQAHYSATKFALDGMAEALRHEVLPFGVYVSVVHPGNFNTALNENRVHTKNTDPDSPYSVAREQATKFYADEEMEARSPSVVARRVEKILNQRRPRLRYLVGSPLELLGVVGKRILPSPIFDFLFRLFYLP
jgi:NAD(P)-dependent dehydrogenase (short-subunit alcohol dehydrogenase family)